jgi:hypothetical protein
MGELESGPTVSAEAAGAVFVAILVTAAWAGVV